MRSIGRVANIWEIPGRKKFKAIQMRGNRNFPLNIATLLCPGAVAERVLGVCGQHLELFELFV